ncbi:MAG: CHAD domain-containing protein [Spirochaetia bacterium]|jgi:inorganic triphosphatase YgiF
MSRETEAKLLVADLVSFNRVKALRALGGFALSAGQDVDVHDTYQDTPSRALLAAGWALRTRERAGEILLTLKSLAPSSGAIHEREELEVTLDRPGDPGEWPDSELRRTVLSLTGGQPIGPLFEVQQKRFARRLASGDRVAAEMSLDQVRVLAGGREREYCELEIELLGDGTREDISAVLGALAGELPLVPSARSKFEEGLLLLDGAAAVTRQPGRPKSVQRLLPGAAGRQLELEAPAGIEEETVLSELQRLGYRSRVRSRKEETRTYFDTQGGSLLRQGRELYATAADSRWHFVRDGRQEHAQKGERDTPPKIGSVGHSVEGITRSRPGVPYLEAVLRETVLSLASMTAPVLGVTICNWRLRSLLHELTEETALTLVVDRGRASPFERDYLVQLLKNGLDLRQLDETMLGFGLRRLGGPLPGAPLPGEYLPVRGDDAPMVCRRILGGEAWRMKANAPGAIRDLDPEFVHDLRVATRRARFACRLFAAVLGELRRDRIRAELSWIAGLLGGVRDLDVLRGRLGFQLALTDADPQFAKTMTNLLDARRVQARAALVPALGSQRFEALLELMTSASREPSDAGQPPGQPASELGRRKLTRALAMMLPWTKRTPGELSAAELHRLRILFKRLRYTAEFFRPVLEEDVIPLVKECVAYQDCLGLHQDARAAVEIITGFAEEPAVRGEPGALLALGALVQVQRDQMKTQRDRFQVLWKSAPALLDTWGPHRSRVERSP